MQEIITYSIGIVVAIIIGRWLYHTLSRKNQGGCTSCDCCKERDKCCDSTPQSPKL